MCGLVGVFGSLVLKDKTIFKEMLLVDTLRGKDGTGIAALSELTEIHKKIGNAFDFLQMDTTKRVIEGASIGLLGHNRAATKSITINSNNAHPFWGERYVVFHNGYISNAFSLAEKGEDTTVDSKVILHMLERGMTLEEVAGKLKGSFAIVVYDTQTRELQVVSNKERPFHYKIIDKTLYYASERNMLAWILDRNGLLAMNISSLGEGELLTATLTKVGSVKDCKVRSVKLAPERVVTAPTVYNYGHERLMDGGHEWWKDGSGKYDKKDTRSFVVTEVIDGVVGKTLRGKNDSGLNCEVCRYTGQVKVGDTYESHVLNYWGGTMILANTGKIKKQEKKEKEDKESERKEWEMQTMHGCGWCGTAPTYEDKESITWLDDITYLCYDCATDPELDLT